MALLLTPSGYRIPLCRCYLTRSYALAKGLTYRTQAELAAYTAKYRDAIEALGYTADQFLSAYSVPFRVTPEKLRGF